MFSDLFRISHFLLHSFKLYISHHVTMNPNKLLRSIILGRIMLRNLLICILGQNRCKKPNFFSCVCDHHLFLITLNLSNSNNLVTYIIFKGKLHNTPIIYFLFDCRNIHLLKIFLPCYQSIFQQ